MVTAFLGLLGFSDLIKRNQEAADDCIKDYQNMLQNAKVDVPNGSVVDDNWSITSFKGWTPNQDGSLIIYSDNPDLFIGQLMNFVATTYIVSTKEFGRQEPDNGRVQSSRIASGEHRNLRYHEASPSLFRGRISLADNKEQNKCLSDSGSMYLAAVNFAKEEKGPRLFCDKNVVDTLKNKKMIRKISEELYEIVWTIGGCEALEKSSSKWDNVQRNISENMLPAAVNLYKMYVGKENVEDQYRELIKLICRGVIKYAHDECNEADKAIEEIRKMLNKQNMNNLDDIISDLSRRNILEDFFV